LPTYSTSGENQTGVVRVDLTGKKNYFFSKEKERRKEKKQNRILAEFQYIFGQRFLKTNNYLSKPSH